MKLLYIFIYLLGVLINEITAESISYKPGHCDITSYNLLEEVVKGELKAYDNPKLRYNSSLRIHYDLYTTKNFDKRQILQHGNATNLHKSNFNPNWPVRIFIHGWVGKSTACPNAAIKDAYLQRGNFNVILVDWSDIALSLNYVRISKKFPEIAAQITEFIKFLQKETNMEMKKVYLIGHSAGCHISGLIGKLLNQDKLGAIVALDPAVLVQLKLPQDSRLAPSDALYVESIHSDIYFLGNPSVKLSQASFFPNWGQGQPQCPNATATELNLACAHFAAVYYFAESIRQPQLFGAIKCTSSSILKYNNCTCAAGSDKCNSDVYMGGEPVTPKMGVFYLSTKRNSPYGLNNTVRIRQVNQANPILTNFASLYIAVLNNN